MRIITCNVNGPRSAHGKGFTQWLARRKPDVACMQDTKARESDLPPEEAAPKGLHARSKASIYTKEVFSDHAPVVIDYDCEL